MPVFEMPNRPGIDHRAVIKINAEQLARLLDLPDGLRVMGVWADPASMAIAISVYDERAGTLEQTLGKVEPGTVAPPFPPEGEFARHSYSVDMGDGTMKEYVRFGWEPPKAVAAERTAHLRSS